MRSWDGGALVTGSYEVVFVGGVRLAGTFDADMCTEDRFICG